jgi:hypothetical protein
MMTLTDYVTCNSAKDVPNEPHYAVMEFQRVNESDGWGGYNIGVKVCYRAFKSKELWETAVEDMEQSKYGSKPDYVAVYVSKAKIKTIIQVDVQES